MTVSRIDWVVMWKLFHYQFFCIYLSLGIPIRFVAARTIGAASSRKTSLSVVVASLVSSVFSTWLPIVPILGVGLPLGLLGKAAIGESFLIGVPLVAISMGIETALLDAVLFRMLLKESGKKRFMTLLIANILNASIALALGLAWAFHHMPIFLATADSRCKQAITPTTPMDWPPPGCECNRGCFANCLFAGQWMVNLAIFLLPPPPTFAGRKSGRMQRRGLPAGRVPWEYEAKLHPLYQEADP